MISRQVSPLLLSMFHRFILSSAQVNDRHGAAYSHSLAQIIMYFEGVFSGLPRESHATRVTIGSSFTTNA